MNVFGGTGKSSRGSRGLRGLPGKDALELCNYLPNTISKSLRENEQKASFVLTSPDDCVIAAKKVKTWKNKRIDPYSNFDAKIPSTLSKIDHSLDQYAIDFPGQYDTGTMSLIYPKTHPFGYFCITFVTTSDDSQTLYANATKTNGETQHVIIALHSRDIIQTIKAYSLQTVIIQTWSRLRRGLK